MIDGAIGEGSPFEREFGYYAHGVDASTSILPSGWEQRLVLVAGESTRFIRGWCLRDNGRELKKTYESIHDPGSTPVTREFIVIL